MSFTLAIVGRPNVGKSTLFNRLVRRRVALVDNTPGLTRDWREGRAHLGDMYFTVLDTAGFGDVRDDSIEADAQRQMEIALSRADVCLFLVDARQGLTPLDYTLADRLRRLSVPIILVANKCDNEKVEASAGECWTLGLGEVVPISAEHDRGMESLRDYLSSFTGESETYDLETDETDGDDNAETIDKPLRMAIIGQPNTGKSTLLNRLLGMERALTGPVAGVTRDTIEIDWEWGGRPVRMFDTAGMRHRPKVADKIENLTVGGSLQAMRFAEVVVLVMEALAPFEKQDLRLAEKVAEEGRPLVMVAAKADLVEDKKSLAEELREKADHLLPQLRGVPVLLLSSHTGYGISRLAPAVFGCQELWNRKLSTSQLNRWLAQMTRWHPPPTLRGRPTHLRYMTQAGIRPPSFVVFANRIGAITPSYKRYLVNGLRESFDLLGVPLRLRLRKGDNPYNPS
ncbi:MAG: ribosome biogenesis GTPase Der [Parvularculales bacterium]